MRARVSSLLPIVVSAVVLGGCILTPPPGEAVYEPPAVVVGEPTYVWHWGIFPHYEVEHHYVIEDEHVNVDDGHYYPGWERTHRWVRNDAGRHRGWFRHDD